MQGRQDDATARKLSPAKIIVPVAIGLGIVVWLMLKESDAAALSEINFGWRAVFWLTVTFLFVGLRTFFYTWRIKALCDNDISWRQSLRIILLWEFASAISPSTVGGTAVAVVFLNKEGISVGRSTTVVLLTSFLDELYFVILFPLLLIFTGTSVLFINSGPASGSLLLNNLVILAVIGYVIILAWVLIVGYGLFVNPRGISRLINSIFRLPFLNRWKEAAARAGNDIIESSRELKLKSAGFWLQAAGTTFLSWSFRYLVVNSILLAFFVFNEHLLIFTRQLVLWIMMIISPTPGGSGFAEIILGNYIADLIPAGGDAAKSLSLAMAVLWRVVTYYPFLVAGAIIVPAWLQRKIIPVIVKKN